jgi:branched-chain amino acid transport system ATP-binding protein
MSEILAVRNLFTRYGRVPILMGLDFAMGEGEFLGILGHNGMGKTTLMRTLMGALPATEGSVSFEGRDITKLPVHARARAGLGLVPQGREIFPTLSVMENLRMGLATAPREDAKVIENVLEEFPRLKRLLDRRGGALSGGEQQLLALARCLCCSTNLPRASSLPSSKKSSKRCCGSSEAGRCP